MGCNHLELSVDEELGNVRARNTKHGHRPCRILSASFPRNCRRSVAIIGPTCCFCAARLFLCLLPLLKCSMYCWLVRSHHAGVAD
jgi:hypothetical protein